MQGQRNKGGRPRGATRKSAAAQISRGGHRLLVWLNERRPESGWVPWVLADAAADLGIAPTSISAALRAFEKRGLVGCWPPAAGRGRRITHVWLSAEARAAALHWSAYGMTAYQRARMTARVAGDLRAAQERGRLPDWAADLLKDDPDYGHIVTR
ncbi:hypothetical protein [Deinococcus sp.]|uniref:hypothetical protein n=1 Tax=Deinococcus sp. TaxID=47478 RepID=UPI0025BC1461|nr:hypothetical protein [Deinococcus sp.]